MFQRREFFGGSPVAGLVAAAGFLVVCSNCGGHTELDSASGSRTPTPVPSMNTVETNSAPNTKPPARPAPPLPRKVDLTELRFSKVVAGPGRYFCGIQLLTGEPPSLDSIGAPASLGKLVCIDGDQLLEEREGPYLDVAFNRDIDGWNYRCAVRDTGALECDGVDLVLPKGKFKSVGVSFFNACGLDENGSMHCWASDLAGGTKALVEQFQILSVSMGNVCAIARNTFHIYCLANGQTTGPFNDSYMDVSVWPNGGCGVSFPPSSVRCWGNPPLQPAPGSEEKVTLAGSFRRLSVNLNGTGCALTSDGAVRCWDVGGLEFIPVKAPTGPFVTISVGINQTCALDQKGHVHCWEPAP